MFSKTLTIKEISIKVLLKEELREFEKLNDNNPTRRIHRKMYQTFPNLQFNSSCTVVSTFPIYSLM